MSVKSIFKTLIGTILFIVVSSMLIELFNVMVTGMQLRYATKIAAYQACVLFTQETYKTTDSKSGTVALPNVVASDGNTYISGDFYIYSDKKAIWNSIYNNPDFESFCKSDIKLNDSGNTKIIDEYRDINSLYNALFGTAVADVPEWDASDDEIEAYNSYTSGQSMMNNLYSCSNIGIPYLDNEIVNRMYQWNLARLLSNCDSDLIVKDEYGDYYVNYKGFRCYCSYAYIDKYEYMVCDISKGDGRAALRKYTSIGTGIDGSAYINSLNTSDYDTEENSKVTIVGINYTIPISYQGITPVKNIFNYVWDNEVYGMNGYSSSVDQKWGLDSISDIGAGQAITELEAGGLKQQYNDAGPAPLAPNQLPTTGKLVYTLMR